MVIPLLANQDLTPMLSYIQNGDVTRIIQKYKLKVGQIFIIFGS